MEQQTTNPPARDTKAKALYWIAAAAMTMATVLASMERPVDWMAIAGRGSLIAALVLLATAKPQETRGKKVLIYGLCAVALALLLARLMNR
jgi:quinol-cytochrome oxidoreductase complex cytochrome b subunit